MSDAPTPPSPAAPTPPAPTSAGSGPTPAAPPPPGAGAGPGNQGSYRPLVLVLVVALLAAAIAWRLREDGAETPGSPAALARAQELLTSAEGLQPAAALEALAQAHHLAPEDPGTNLALGRALMRQQRPAEALPLLAKARAGRPDDPEAHFLAGKAFSHLQRLDDASAAFERALALDPSYPEAHYQLAVVAFARGDHEGILRHLDASAAAAQGAESALATQMRVAALEGLGRHAETIAPLTSMLSRVPPAERVRLRRTIQDLTVSSRGWAAALQEARAEVEAGAAAPDATALFLCGRLMAQHPRTAAEAGPMFERALAADPSLAFAAAALGVQEVREGDLEAGRARLAEALKLDPTLGEAELGLALLDDVAGNFADARARYERLLAGGHASEAVLDGIKDALLGAGDGEQALAFARSVPPDVPVRPWLEAQVLARLGQADALREVMDAAKPASGPGRWKWRGNQGVLLCEAGRVEDARVVFDEALAAVPQGERVPAALLLWAGISRVPADLEGARALWRRGAETGAEHGPEAPFTWSCRHLLGEATREELHAAARVAGAHVRGNDAWFVEGLALELAGKKDEARAALERCRETSRGDELPARLVEPALARLGG